MIDRTLLRKLSDRDYRDAYVESYVRGTISLQIKELRIGANLSQVEFSKLIKKPQSVISRLESTDYAGTSIQTLLDIAKSLDIGLSVQFVDHKEFSRRYHDISPAALRVKRFHQINWTEKQGAMAFSSATTRPLATEVNVREEVGSWKRPLLLEEKISLGVKVQNTERYIQIPQWSA